jgi:Kef-type K+ transport system membrane component KefB
MFQEIVNAFGQLGAQGSHGGEAALRLLVLQLAVILIASGVGALIARRVLGQPAVIGQILAGIALGPSVLGAFAPGLQARLIPAESTSLLGGLAELGLVLLVFQVGLEIDFRKHLGGSGVKTVVSIGLCAFLVPLVAGFFVAPLFAAPLGAEVKDAFGFQLIFACALAITAVPVLARIFAELGLAHSRVAALSIGAAALNDVLGWVVLGGIAAYVSGSWNTVTLLTQLGSIVIGLLLVFKLVGPVLGYLINADLGQNDGRLSSRAIMWVLLVVCVAAVVSSAIGVFALIGGLVVGVALHGHRKLAEEWDRSVAPLVQALFVPLFFTLTGLRTDLGALNGMTSVWLLGAVLALSVTTKLASGYAAARLSGEQPGVAFAVGVAMNTRGLMELVALNVGLSLGILPPSMFTILVLSAIASTYIAAPLLRRALGLHVATTTAQRLSFSSSLQPAPRSST